METVSVEGLMTDMLVSERRRILPKMWSVKMHIQYLWNFTMGVPGENCSAGGDTHQIYAASLQFRKLKSSQQHLVIKLHNHASSSL